MTATTEATSSDALRQAYRAVRGLKDRIAELDRPGRYEPIAVVGIGCRFPGGNSAAEFWDTLVTGSDAVTDIPADRFDVDHYHNPDPDSVGTIRSRRGGFVGDLDAFDHEFFGISRREAEMMDPQQRLILEAAWHALEDAQIPVGDLAGSRTGVYVGASASDYAMEAPQHPDELSAYTSSGTNHSAIPGRVSYLLDFIGPAVAVDTACSSALTALHIACQGLQSHDCDVALAGGVNVVMSALPSIAFSNYGIQSARGSSCTFDAESDGCVRGEGAGLLVLKRLTDARAAGDRVLAVVRGSAVNQDGRSSGFTAPRGSSQQACIRTALDKAQVDPATVGLVECHGTGTPLGDPIEVGALSQVYGLAGQPCWLGAVKSNISHLEAASGVAGLVKVIEALRHGQIPPNLHFNRLNPNIEMGRADLRIPVEAQPWPRIPGPRRAAVSAFGFTGTNAHVILEEAAAAPAAPEEAAPATVPNRSVLTISARSAESLNVLADRYRDRLTDPGTPLADLCHAANTARTPQRHRLAVVGADAQRIADELEAHSEGWPTDAVFTGEAGRSEVVFLYSGQGAQYPGMARQLYRDCQVVRETVDHCAAILDPLLPQPLLEVVNGGDEHLLARMDFAQPALFVMEVALTRLWRSWGVEPSAVMGHSLGEFTAAWAAGVHELDELLPVVAARGRLLAGLPVVGRMAAVGASAAQVNELLAGYPGLGIGAINSPTSVTVTGPDTEVAAFVAAVHDQGVRAKLLAIRAGSHSPLVEPMLAEFSEVLAGLTARPPRLPLIGNLHGDLWDAATPIDTDYWLQQLRRPVQFEQGVATTRMLGLRTFLEVSPAPRLLGMVDECLTDDEPRLLLPTLRPGKDDWHTALASAAQLYVRGTDVDWAAVESCPAPARVELPLYPFRPVQCPVVRGAGRDERRAATAGTGTAADLLYEVTWRPAGPATPAGAGRSVLVVTAPEWAAAAAAAGANHCAPAQLPDALAAAGSDTDVVLVVTDDDTGDDPGDDELARQRRIVRTVVAVARTVAALPDGFEAKLHLVTRGAVATGREAGDALCPRTAAVWGIGRALQQELPTRMGVMVDLDPVRQPGWSLADLILTIRGAGEEDQLALRGNDRLVPRLVRLDAAGGRTRVKLRPDASYLVTGGFGGVGFAGARTLVAHGARRIILAGRTELPPRTEWQAAEGALRERIDVVLDLEARGVSVMPVALDVSDPGAVRRFVTQHRAEGWPAIRGVLHAAGFGDMSPLDQIDQRVIDACLGPKSVGAESLVSAFAGQPPDFLVLYSSLGSVLSSPFTATYGGANAILDTRAAALRAGGVPATTISWGPWNRVGMAADQRQQAAITQGMGLLDEDAAAAALWQAINQPAAHVVVADIDWQQWGRHYREASGSRILDRLVADAASGPAEILPDRAEILATPAGERLDMVADRLSRALAELIGATHDRVADDTPLFGIGVDSLMAIELKNRMERLTGVTVPMATFLGGATIREIAHSLVVGCESAIGDGPDAISRRDEDADALGAALADLGVEL